MGKPELKADKFERAWQLEEWDKKVRAAEVYMSEERCAADLKDVMKRIEKRKTIEKIAPKLPTFELDDPLNEVDELDD